MFNNESGVKTNWPESILLLNKTYLWDEHDIGDVYVHTEKAFILETFYVLNWITLHPHYKQCYFHWSEIGG